MRLLAGRGFTPQDAGQSDRLGDQSNHGTTLLRGAVVALIARCLPARRAAKVDPMGTGSRQSLVSQMTFSSARPDEKELDNLLLLLRMKNVDGRLGSSGSG